jgi:hypothetical protein
MQCAEKNRTPSIVVLTSCEGEMYQQDIGVHYHVDLARQPSSRTTYVVEIIDRDMLLADARARRRHRLSAPQRQIGG